MAHLPGIGQGLTAPLPDLVNRRHLSPARHASGMAGSGFRFDPACPQLLGKRVPQALQIGFPQVQLLTIFANRAQRQVHMGMMRIRVQGHRVVVPPLKLLPCQCPDRVFHRFRICRAGHRKYDTGRDPGPVSRGAFAAILVVLLHPLAVDHTDLLPSRKGLAPVVLDLDLSIPTNVGEML